MKMLSTLCLVVFLFSGCRKILDFWQQHHNPPQPSAPCRISGWQTFEGNREEPPLFLHFFYDAQGKPIRVTEDGAETNPGAINDTFSYDSKQRLILHKKGGGGGTDEYVYTGSASMPVRDTFTDYNESKWVSRFTYDSKQRIIREETSLVYTWEGWVENPDTTVTRYVYDANGDRQITGRETVLYTDKKSIHSLHRTWQIIYRNFSAHASQAAAEFNEYNLPVTYSGSINAPQFYQPFYGGPETPISYDCAPLP